MDARNLIFGSALLLAACDTGDGDLAAADVPQAAPPAEEVLVAEDVSVTGAGAEPAVPIVLQSPVGVAPVDGPEAVREPLTAEIDLNGDGVNEILIYLSAAQFCGSGGCNLEIAQQTVGGQLRPVGSLTVTRLPIGVLETSTNGWRDLAVAIGGGGLPYGMVRVPFDGQAYASNPTSAPAERTDEAFETLIEAVPRAPSQLG